MQGLRIPAAPARLLLAKTHPWWPSLVHANGAPHELRALHLRYVKETFRPTVGAAAQNVLVTYYSLQRQGARKAYSCWRHIDDT